MKAALSIVLAGLLVTTPLEQVFAQAAQQEAVSVQQTPDSSGHRLIGVPPVTANTSRLWEPLASKNVFAEIFAEDGSITGPAPIPDGAKAVIIVVGVLLALALLILVICFIPGNPSNCLGTS